MNAVKKVINKLKITVVEVVIIIIVGLGTISEVGGLGEIICWEVIENKSRIEANGERIRLE